MSRLTEKQEKFCRKVVELNNNTEAYRECYNATRMKDNTVHRAAFELLANPKVAERIEELRESHRERHSVTVDDLLAELEEARTVALTATTPQTSAAVSSTMGKAKLLGLDKQLIEHSGEVTTRTVLSDFYE